MELLVLYSSLNSTKPNSLLLQSIISSESLDICIIKTEILNNTSSAKSLSLTVSKQFILTLLNPKSPASYSLSVQYGVPASAAHPIGETFPLV